jgi:O-antigen/teichoic acid export membrane protein
MKDKKESLGSRSARTFSVLAIGRVIGLLLGIASIIIVARMLGPVGYGTYTLAFAFFSLIGATNNFGFGVYLTKHIAEYEEKKDIAGLGRVLSAGYLSVIVMGVLLTILGICLSGLISSLLIDSNIPVFTLMLASSVIFFFMLYGTSDYALIGLGMNTAAVVLENAENVILLFGSVGLVALGYGVDGALAGLLISYVFAGVAGTCFVFKEANKRMKMKLGWPSLRDMKHAFAFSMPVAVNNFLSNVSVNIATLFLSFFISASAIGNFGIANRARNVLSVFYMTTAVTLLPTLTIAASREQKRGRFEYVYNKVLLYSMLATIPLIIYIGVYATPLIYLFISQEFNSAPMYLTLIALGTVINLAGTYVTSLFISKGKTRQLLSYSVLATMAQIIALAILVPTWGAIGAIIAIFFVGGAVNSYLFLKGAEKVLMVKTYGKEMAMAIACNAALALVLASGLLIGDFMVQLAYGLVMLVVAYPPLLVLFGVVEEHDLRLLEKSVEKVPSLRSLVWPVLAYFKILMLHKAIAMF